MKHKDESRQAIRLLCYTWREAAGFSSTPPDKLRFADFYSWIEENHAQFLNFRTTAEIRDDVESWFNLEFGPPRRR